MSLHELTDTIAAIATPLGVGGISIIRVSGSDSLKICSQLINNKQWIPNRIFFSQLKYHNIVYDEGLISYFCAPNSYTGEDVVEINCHGGCVSAKKILEILVEAGARIAGPGEFTRRAFLNGKMDLCQAEAVIDLIEAKTESSGSLAVGQLAGEVSSKIKSIRKEILDLVAHLEVHLDYPEEEELSLDYQSVILKISNNLQVLADSFKTGKLLKNGALIVISGIPNAGKSSLLNAILKEDRAIVSSVPGTTRDVLEEQFQLKGIPYRIMDTAGLRDSQDEIEIEGIKRAEKAIAQAEILIRVIDATVDIKSQIENKHESQQLINFVNKLDLVEDKLLLENELKILQDDYLISGSLKNGEGLDSLFSCLEVISKEYLNKGPVISNERHYQQIKHALIALEEVVASINQEMSVDCWLIDLRKVLGCLGEIMGEDVSEEILDNIFSRFCVGK